MGYAGSKKRETKLFSRVYGYDRCIDAFLGSLLRSMCRASWLT